MVSRPTASGPAPPGWLGRARLWAGRSGVVAERGPGLGPGLAQAADQVDRRALLVVVDAEAVAERGHLADLAELLVQQERVQADGQGGGGGRRRRAPEPEAVLAAVGGRQAVPGAVPGD